MKIEQIRQAKAAIFDEKTLLLITDNITALEITIPNTEVVIKTEDEVIGVKGKLSRKLVAAQVFSNTSKRRKLEALVHPYVYQRIRSELSKVQSGVVVLEVPLLFETGFNRLCDVTVAILAGEKQILKRLQKSGYAPHEVRARLQAQLPGREKKKRADLYILNSSSKNLLMKKTKRVWFKLKSLLN